MRLIQPTKLSACCSETALLERMREEVGMPQRGGRACLSVGQTCRVQPSGSALWDKRIVLLSEVAILVILVSRGASDS